MNDSGQRPITQNRILLLLLALTLIRGLIYASVTIPWWQGHDEEYHFAQTKWLIDQWTTTPPSPDQNWPQEMIASFAAFPMSRWTLSSEHQPNLVNISDRYANFKRPSFSYYPYAWLGHFLTQQDILSQLFALRIVSTLITCGTILFAFLSAKQIFADSLMAQILVPWFIIFNPSFMVINSTVNDGNLAVLLSTIIFYLLLREITQQRTGWRSALAFGLTSLALWAEPTAYFLLLVWGVLVFTQAWKLGWKFWLWGGIVGALSITLIFLFPSRLPDMIAAYRQYNVSVEGIAYVLSSQYFWDVFSGFWIILGFFVYRLDQVWYTTLLVFSSLAGIGLLIYTWSFLKRNGLFLSTEQKSLLFSLLFAGMSITIMVGLAILGYEGKEGRLARYVFPAIVPLSILMVTGWRALLPTTWPNAGLLLLAGGLFLFDTMVWLNYAVPWYYPFWPH